MCVVCVLWGCVSFFVVLAVLKLIVLTRLVLLSEIHLLLLLQFWD